MAQCKRHPRIETNLFCNKCGDPICPKCLVQTPVGGRCPSCARLSRIPTYQVSGKYYLRAVGAAFGLAVGCGLIWGLIRVFVPLVYLGWLVGPAVGFVIGEGITIAVNRKAGLKLAIIGGAAVVCAYLIAMFTFWQGHFSFFDILAVALGIFVSVGRLR
jgi:hypothetical protein